MVGDISIEILTSFGEIFNKYKDVSLWHYTTADGLQGILKSGEIWATQISCLNDASEMTFYMEALRRCLSAKNVKAEDAFFSYLNEKICSREVYVAGFSEVSDGLPHWICYGEGEGGYSIKFCFENRESDSEACIPVEDAGSNWFYKVSYGDNELDTLLSRVPLSNELLSEKNEDLLETIELVAPFVKNESFKHEAEWRWVFLRDEDKHGHKELNFRQRQGMLARSVGLPVRLGVDSSPRKLPIKEIMIGPCRYPKVSEVSVKALLKKYGYSSDIAVTVSKVPFRRL